MKTKIILILSALTFNINAQTTDLKKKASMEFDKNSTKYEEKETTIASNDVFLGDLNGDGKKDAVVFYSLAPKDGGNALMGMGVVVFLNNGGNLKEVTAFRPKFNFIVKEIANNKLHVIKQEYSKDDMPGFPSIETHLYYILNGQNQLQQSKTY